MVRLRGLNEMRLSSLEESQVHEVEEEEDEDRVEDMIVIPPHKSPSILIKEEELEGYLKVRKKRCMVMLDEILTFLLNFSVVFIYLYVCMNV